MKRLKGRRPSPAMTVAIAALIVALAGTAMAAPTAIKSILNKQEKKQVKNIAKNQINQAAPGLSVARANTAGRAEAATRAEAAGRADTAANADALGGVELKNIVVAESVNPGGTCDPSSATLVNCATVNLTLPHEGRVFLIGTAGQIAFNNAQTQGDCLFRVDGVNSGGSVHVGNQYAPAVTGALSLNLPNGFATTFVTGPVSAGAHAFTLACSESVADVLFAGPQISAALVGSG
jgi:hypothetical protein